MIKKNNLSELGKTNLILQIKRFHQLPNIKEEPRSFQRGKKLSYKNRTIFKSDFSSTTLEVKKCTQTSEENYLFFSFLWYWSLNSGPSP
jgi:hypothetical protein